MGRSRCETVVGEFEAARGCRGRAIEHLAPEAFQSGANWRARSNRVRSWTDLRVCAHDQERRAGKVGSRFGKEIFPGRQELSTQLRTLRRRFSFAMFGRSRLDAPRASAKRIFQLVEEFHAADSGWPRRKRE